MINLNVGLAFLGSNNYYAKELEVIDKSIALLENKYKDENIKLITNKKLNITNEDVISTINYLDNQNIDLLIIQTSSFCDEPIFEEFIKINCIKLVWAPYEEFKTGDVKLHSLLSMFVSTSNMHHKHGKSIIKDWLYGNSNLLFPKLNDYFSAIKALKRLKHSKIGLIGKTAYGFNNMNYGLEEAKERYGFKTESFSEQNLINRAKKIDDDRVSQTFIDFKFKKNNIFVTNKSIDHTLRLYLALKDLIEEKKLSALSVSCWPTFQSEYEITPCVTLSLINDVLKIPVSCEGDLMGVVTMIVANELSKSTSMVYDIADILEDKESLLLWHCGITTCLLMSNKMEDLNIINHPMINRKNSTQKSLGCSFDGSFKTQKVTALRLSNIKNKIFSLSGDIEDIDVKGFTGTRGWLTNITILNKTISISKIIDLIVKNGIEHHLVVVPGDISKQLKAFSTISELEILE